MIYARPVVRGARAPTFTPEGGGHRGHLFQDKNEENEKNDKKEGKNWPKIKSLLPPLCVKDLFSSN